MNQITKFEIGAYEVDWDAHEAEDAYFSGHGLIPWWLVDVDLDDAERARVAQREAETGSWVDASELRVAILERKQKATRARLIREGRGYYDGGAHFGA